MTGHPTELLAAFVDGSIADSDQAVLSAHLQSCRQCREEVRLARSAKEALATLTQVPAPEGLSQEAVKRARQGRPEPGGDRSYRIVWAGAAAALVVVVAWVGVRAVTKTSAPVRESAVSLASPAPGPDNEPGSLDHDGNYDAGEVTALTQQAAREGNKTAGDNDTGVAAPSAPNASASPTAAGGGGSASTTKAASSQIGGRCLKKAGVFERGGSLVKVMQARYDGRPAYIAVLYEPSPDGGPADRAVTWVLAKSDCEVLDFSQHLFNPPSPVNSPFAPAS